MKRMLIASAVAAIFTAGQMSPVAAQDAVPLPEAAAAYQGCWNGTLASDAPAAPPASTGRRPTGLATNASGTSTVSVNLEFTGASVQNGQTVVSAVYSGRSSNPLAPASGEPVQVSAPITGNRVRFVTSGSANIEVVPQDDGTFQAWREVNSSDPRAQGGVREHGTLTRC